MKKTAIESNSTDEQRNSFIKRFESLDKEQKEAVNERGNCLILAGAGSGKTTVSTVKVASRLFEDVHPANLMMLTFTNKAAKEMKERVSSLHPKGGSVSVSTFHGLAYKYLSNNRKEVFLNLKRYGQNISDRKISLMLPDEQSSIIEFIIRSGELDDEIIREFGSTKIEVNKIVSRIVSIISREKDTNGHEIFTKGVASTRNKFKRMKNLEFLVFELYEKHLADNCRIDLDDLVNVSVIGMTNFPSTIPKLNLLVVDEFQDTSKAQYRLVELLASELNEGGSVTVVGDDDQAIYQWRGANSSGVSDFKSDFGARLIRLESNYRSTENIVNAANAVIRKNKERLGKEMFSGKGQVGSPLNYFIFDDTRSEMLRIANFCKRKVNEAPPSEEAENSLAILFRTNFYGDCLSLVLSSAGIPFVRVGGSSVMKKKEMKRLFSFLYAANNPHDIVAFSGGVEDFCFGLGTSEAKKKSFLFEQSKNADSIFQAMLNESESTSKFTIKEKKLYWFAGLLARARREVGKDILKLKDFIEQETIYDESFNWDVFDPVYCLRSSLSSVAEPSSVDLVPKDPAQTSLDLGQPVLSSQSRSCVGDVRGEPVPSSSMSLINFLCSVASDAKKGDALDLLEKRKIRLCLFVEGSAETAKDNDLLSLNDFLSFYSMNGKDSAETNISLVNLMTIHAAKGLEFDSVVVGGCDRDTFIKENSNSDHVYSYNETEESRRLFYVALTRARNQLILTRSKTGDGGKKLFELPFVSDIDSSLIKSNDCSSGENTKSEKYNKTPYQGRANFR